jgi:YVTN family beta-propeller protein
MVVALAGRSPGLRQKRKHSIAATLRVGTIPVGLSISPDGTHAYVNDSGSNSVSVIDTGTNAVLAIVPVEIQPVTENIS